jgi:hypothetical protein
MSINALHFLFRIYSQVALDVLALELLRTLHAFALRLSESLRRVVVRAACIRLLDCVEVIVGMLRKPCANCLVEHSTARIRIHALQCTRQQSARARTKNSAAVCNSVTSLQNSQLILPIRTVPRSPVGSGRRCISQLYT